MTEETKGERLVSFGCDWLTVTFSDYDFHSRAVVFIGDLREWEIACGSKIVPWRAMGYSGWHCGQVDYGERPDGHIVRLSGEVARLFWWRLFPMSTRVSRFDLQITVDIGRNPTKEVTGLYNRLYSHWKSRQNRPSIRLVCGTNVGATLYLGKRSSERFGRLYDKGAESGDDKLFNCVRAEIELKGRRASQVASQIFACDNVLKATAGLILRYFDVYACPLRFVSDRVLEQCPAWILESSMKFLPLHRTSPDLDKSLRWALQAWPRTAEHLVRNGKREILLDALQLREDVLEFADAN